MRFSVIVLNLTQIQYDSVGRSQSNLGAVKLSTIVSVAVLQSLVTPSTLIDCTHFGDIFLVIIMFVVMVFLITNTSNPRNSNIIRIHLQRKVLQRLRVMHSLGAVPLGQLQHPIISIRVVLDKALSESRQVV